MKVTGGLRVFYQQFKHYREVQEYGRSSERQRRVGKRLMRVTTGCIRHRPRRLWWGKDGNVETVLRRGWVLHRRVEWTCSGWVETPSVEFRIQRVCRLQTTREKYKICETTLSSSLDTYSVVVYVFPENRFERVRWR